jgi:hypothetical protein
MSTINIKSGGRNRDFSSVMKAVALWMLFVGALVLAGVATFTTFEGLMKVIAAIAALPTAIGIQTMVFGAEMLFAHARSARQRIFALVTFGVAETVSFAFTFLFFFTFVNGRVAVRHNAIFSTAAFRTAQSQLQNVAGKVKDTELRELDQQDVELRAQRKLLSSDADTRRRQAERLAEENRILAVQLRPADEPQNNLIRKRIQQNRITIQNCRADASTLKLRVATLAEQEQLISNRRRSAESFTPNFLAVPDGAWTSLQREYDALAAAHGRLAGGDTIQLPPAPSPPLYDSAGRILQGQDDQFNEALTRMTEPWGAVVWWAFILSAAVEFPGFIALLATRPIGRDWPTRMYAVGNWMRRLRRSIDSAEGVVPFFWKSGFSFFFRRPIRPGHPTVHAYEDLIEELQMRMRTELKEAVAPVSLVTILETRLDALHADLIYRNYSLVAELDDDVTSTLEHCVAAVKAAALTHEQEEHLIHVLQEETDQLRTLYRAGEANNEKNDKEKCNEPTQTHA